MSQGSTAPCCKSSLWGLNCRYTAVYPINTPGGHSGDKSWSAHSFCSSVPYLCALDRECASLRTTLEEREKSSIRLAHQVEALEATRADLLEVQTRLRAELDSCHGSPVFPLCFNAILLPKIAEINDLTEKMLALSKTKSELQSKLTAATDTISSCQVEALLQRSSDIFPSDCSLRKQNCNRNVTHLPSTTPGCQTSSRNDARSC